jgi:hypothetical protein
VNPLLIPGQLAVAGIETAGEAAHRTLDHFNGDVRIGCSDLLSRAAGFLEAPVGEYS